MHAATCLVGVDLTHQLPNHFCRHRWSGLPQRERGYRHFAALLNGLSCSHCTGAAKRKQLSSDSLTNCLRQLDKPGHWAAEHLLTFVTLAVQRIHMANSRAL